MKNYVVQVDLPVLVHVAAVGEDDAEKLGDALFADAWEVMNQALRGDPVGARVSLGARYDDTEVSEDWLQEPDPEKEG